MVALRVGSSAARLSYQSYEEFRALLPRIEREARLAFRYLDPEERQEAIAEVVARAFVMYRRLVDRGKSERAFATPLATFGIRAFRSGRRVGSGERTRDVYSKKAQTKRGFTIEHLGDPHEGKWKEALIENRRTPVPDQVQFRVDFPNWLSTLRRRDRRIAVKLAEGDKSKDVAKRFRLSPARVCQLRSELKQGWEAFLGEGDEAEVAAVAV